MLGVIVVVVLYLSLNLAYLWVLTPAQIAASPALAADMARAVAGDGRRAIRRAADRRVEPRVSRGRDSDRPAAATTRWRPTACSSAARRALHPRYHTPVFALWFQAAVSLVLLTTNTYDQLLSYVVFADWLFFGLTAGALLIVARAANPCAAAAHDRARCPAIRGRPLLFIAVAAGIVLNSFVAYPTQSLIGSAILASRRSRFLCRAGLKACATKWAGLACLNGPLLCYVYADSG